MQKLKKNASLLLISFLSFSCQVVKLQVKQYNYDAVEDVCYERDYEYSKNFIGHRSNFIEVDKIHCDLITGYKPEDFIKVYNWQENVRRNLSTKIK